MDVHWKAVYILARKQGCSEGDDRWIVGAQKLFHIVDVGVSTPVCRVG